MEQRFYQLQVAGCTRELPILNISDKLAIAGFVILGDVELVTRAAKDLVKKLPYEADFVMTAETKGIPLAAEVAKNLGPVSYTHLTLPTTLHECRSRWSPYH